MIIREPFKPRGFLWFDFPFRLYQKSQSTTKKEGFFLQKPPFDTRKPFT